MASPADSLEIKTSLQKWIKKFIAKADASNIKLFKRKFNQRG
jgi:hemerythrin